MIIVVLYYIAKHNIYYKKKIRKKVTYPHWKAAGSFREPFPVHTTAYVQLDIVYSAPTAPDELHSANI